MSLRNLMRAVLALVLLASTARADIESVLVKKGLAAYAELDYARAIALLDQARAESLTREEKLATWQTLGLAHVGLGHTDEAKAAFQHLLRLDPSFQLDRSVAPKVRAIFEEAKAQAATSGRVSGPALPSVTAQLDPVALHEGRPVVVRVSYPGGVAQKMALYYRASGQASFSRLTVDGREGRFEATVPGLSVTPPALEYHVALLDDAGAAVASAGTLGQPLSAQVARKKMPLYKKGWFWGVIGGVAAAGAVAAALAVTLPRSGTSAVTVIPQ
jgi:tetratricopeptide (TPR) repeat protein